MKLKRENKNNHHLYNNSQSSSLIALRILLKLYKYRLHLIVFTMLSFIYTDFSFAQPALVRWELSSDTNVTQIVGPIVSSAEFLSNMEIHDYSLVAGVDVPCQGTTITGGTWPSESSQNDKRYIQFAVTVKPGITFNIDSVSMYYAGRGGHLMNINIAYSSDPGFSNSILLNPQPIVISDNVPTMTLLKYSINRYIEYSQTFYLRIYPWYSYSSTIQTKYVCLHNVIISGTTSGQVIPVKPVVSTSRVTDVSINSAVCGGTVSFDGDATVTARGVCWNTTGNPTTNNNKTIDGNGLGSFVSNLTSLTSNTKYYVRAYATNGAGTAYGEQDSLITLNALSIPIVTTADTIKVIGTSAFCYGNVVHWGGTEISERGFCYNTTGNPTINDARVWINGNSGEYSIIIAKLNNNTKYYLRAYATNSLGTGYGSIKEIYIPSTLKGAFADGIHKDTGVIQAAIDSCTNAGGGTVHFENGIYLTAPFELKSNVTLIVDSTASIIASQDMYDFYPDDFDTTGGSNPSSYRPLITSNYADNITIAGNGIIDGQGEPWWQAFRSGTITTRPRLIQLNHGKHLLLKDITLKNSPQFHFVPSWCIDVTVDNVTILSPEDAPNTDGIDPMTSHHIRIKNCYIDTGDDNVAIKSGNYDPSYPNAGSSDIIVSDCTFLNGHGVSIGSETNGDVDSMLVENCSFNGTDNGIRIKSNRTRGGNVRGITYKNLTMTNVGYPILFSEYYPDVPDQNDPPQQITSTTPYYHDITVEGLTATNCRYGGIIIGLPETPMTNIYLSNVNISANTGLRIRNAAVDTSNIGIHVNSGPPIIFEVNGILTGAESESNSSLPGKFTLYQNFPNPFNPSTIIKYSIAKTSFVSLIVFNILGEEIKSLVDKEQNAGTYQINFDASALSSGIYFYRIKAENYTETRKFVLLK